MTLADTINRMIETALKSAKISSASPGHINDVQEILNFDKPDLEAELRGDEGDDPEQIKQQKETESAVTQIQKFKVGNVGEINRMTRAQFGNVRALANNPVQFMISQVFGRFAKGAGVIAFALIIFEAVKFVINELLKPGRLLDRRFRRDISNELLAFRAREEKQRLLVGRSSIIVTTIGGLRGGEGQRSSNLRALAGLQPQPLTSNLQQPTTEVQASGQDLSVSRGRKRFRQ